MCESFSLSGSEPVCLSSVPFKLQEGEVRIISKSQCQSYFDMKTITPRMLCAGYEAGTVDSCMVRSAMVLLGLGFTVFLCSL